jgi:hypothetical protein
MAQQWQRFTTWVGADTSAVRVGLGIGALLVVCGLCSVGLAVANGGGGKPTRANTVPTATSRPTALTATPQPTAKPTATATATPSGPQPITAATLGGRESDFTAKYGDPVNPAGTVRTYPPATIQGASVRISINTSATGSPDRARYLLLVPSDSGTTWDGTTANTIAKTFLPSDATYVKDMQVADFGLEHIYHSADLAASLPADLFIDAATNQPVPPGTFYLSCGNQVDPQGGCSLQVGE